MIESLDLFCGAGGLSLGLSYNHKIKVINPKTKVESEVVLEGLASFFA